MSARGDEPEVPAADPVDELASALVDGEALGAERARADEPAVAARVAAFEAVAARVGAPVDPPDDLARERAIRAALAAHSPARARRRPPAWLPAAAAVAVVVVGLGLLVAAIGPSDDDAAETAATLAEGGDEATTLEDSDGSAGAGGSTAAPGAEALARALFLGDHPDAASLEATLHSAARMTGAGQAADSAAGSGGVPCADRADADVVLTATAVLAGEAVTVLVRETPAGIRSYVALAAATCALVAEGDL